MAGFQSSPFFTLMLLDIVNNSSVLQDIVRSITTPARQLAIVFYTFVITVVRAPARPAGRLLGPEPTPFTRWPGHLRAIRCGVL
jgi:hypothetical protein